MHRIKLIFCQKKNTCAEHCSVRNDIGTYIVCSKCNVAIEFCMLNFSLYLYTNLFHTYTYIQPFLLYKTYICCRSIQCSEGYS